MNDSEKTQPMNQYARKSRQELSEERLEQEVVEEINDQQLEGIQGGALPRDVNTGHDVFPIITHTATGHTELRHLPPIAMPIDLNTGHHVVPVIVYTPPDAHSRTNSPAGPSNPARASSPVRSPRR